MSLLLLFTICAGILLSLGTVFFFEWLYEEYIIWAFE
jgi:hypothetical protein